MPLTGTATFTRSVGRGDPERGGAAAADARDSNPSRIDVGPADKIVDAANAVEAFHAGGRVAPRVPPPAALVVGAVMRRGDFAQFQRVEDQADISMPREPDAVRLVGGFVPAPGLGANVRTRRALPAAGGPAANLLGR